MGNLESVGIDGGSEFKIEFNDGSLLFLLVLVLNIKDPVIPVIVVSLEEDGPFLFNSFFFSSDINFKFNFNFCDVDIELMSNFSSMEEEIFIKFKVNKFDLVY